MNQAFVNPPPGTQQVPPSVGPTRSASLLAFDLLRGEMGVTESVESVYHYLFDTMPNVDGGTAALTLLPPDVKDGWVRLDDRAWLREWAQPGTRYSVAPRERGDAEQAQSMPQVSKIARSQGVVAIHDTHLLDPEWGADAEELDSLNVRAVITTSVLADDVMYGSIALARSEPGLWPETGIADMLLLTSALGGRLAIERSKIAVAEAIQRGDQARGSQQQFFSAVGHELRTPIAAIVGTAEALQGEARRHHRNLLAAARAAQRPADGAPAQPESQHLTELAEFADVVSEDASTMLTAGEQMLGVINDLLDAGQKLDAHSDRDWVNVAAAVKDVHHWVRVPAMAAGVEVTIDVPADLRVFSTPTGMRQVLANLLGNAITYSPDGSTVHVAAVETPGDHGEPHVYITVRDEGPGLTAEQQALAFRPFVRFSEKRGTGLGLAVCRALVERDGGLIGVTSAPGAGSTFWIDLPGARA